MRLRAVLTVVAVLEICGKGYSQNSWTMSAVPLWPKNGDISNLPSDQYVFLEMPQNDYVVAIRSANGQVQRLVHAPIHNRVAPDVTATVSREPDGRFHYKYSVANASSAGMQIGRWAMAVEQVGYRVEPSYTGPVSLTNPGWTGRKSWSKLPGISRDRHEVYEWLAPSDGALAAGQTLSGFEVISDLAPGFVLGVFYGQPSMPEMTDEDWASLPAPAAAQLRSALATAFDGQSLQIIGPRFAADARPDMVQANFLFGLRDMKMRNRITDDSAPEKELESALSEALNQPDKAFNKTWLGRLKVDGKERETEFINAMKLTLGFQGTR